MHEECRTLHADGSKLEATVLREYGVETPEAKRVYKALSEAGLLAALPRLRSGHSPQGHMSDLSKSGPLWDLACDIPDLSLRCPPHHVHHLRSVTQRAPSLRGITRHKLRINFASLLAAAGVDSGSAAPVIAPACLARRRSAAERSPERGWRLPRSQPCRRAARQAPASQR